MMNENGAYQNADDIMIREFYCRQIIRSEANNIAVVAKQRESLDHLLINRQVGSCDLIVTWADLSE